jgi:hypothetical protein
MRMAMPQIRSQGKTDSTASSLTDGLVDEMLAHYIHWRHDAAVAADAYRNWSTATAGEEGALRYSAYVAALDDEESSAIAYARAAVEVGRALQRDQSVSDRA